MLIIDTDPGLDDLVALAISARRDEPIVITTVYGNAPLDVVTDNAAWIAAELDIGCAAGPPDRDSDARCIYRGASSPLAGDRIDATHIHGDDGLGGYSRGEGRAAIGTHAASCAIVAAVTSAAAAGEPTQILALGPLTNLVLAIAMAPDLPERVDSLVVMGGAPSLVGNASPFAEFNIAADPSAADQVLAAFTNTTLVTWDLCQQLQTPTQAVADATGSPLVADVLAYLARDTPGRSGCLPDAIAAAIALDPSLVTDGEYGVPIAIHDYSPLRGATPVVESERIPDRPAVWIPTRLNAPSLVEIAERFLA